MIIHKMRFDALNLVGRMNSIDNKRRLRFGKMFLEVFQVKTFDPKESFDSARVAPRAATEKQDHALHGNYCLPTSDCVEDFVKFDREDFEPQMGFDLDLMTIMSQHVRDIGRFSNVDIDDKLIAEIEGLGALFLTVQGCGDYVSIASAIFLYARRFYSKSVSSQVLEYVRDMFDIQPQSGIEDSSVSPDWLELMRDARENWSLCKTNVLFKQLSKLISLLVTLGMCKASSVTFKIDNLVIFEPELTKVHASAFDFIDAALQTVTHFAESMYYCFQSKSLKPLLFSNKEAQEMDEEYNNIMAWWELVRNGNLRRVANMDDKDFDRRLEALATKVRTVSASRDGFEKKLLHEKLVKLSNIKNDFVDLKISSGVREAPFAIEYFGESSQGKTTIADQITDALLKSASLPLDKQFRATHNPNDAFMSNWRTDKVVMNINDMANEKAVFVSQPPTRFIIDCCNNEPFYANMAELHAKGKVFVEMDLLNVSTNKKDLDAGKYSNCPYSIQRRMHAVITVRARDEFQRYEDGEPQGLDSDKVDAYYEKMGFEPLFEDLWVLSVERARRPSDMTHLASYRYVEHRGKVLKDVSFRDVLQYMIEAFTKHREGQKKIVSRSKKRAVDILTCDVDGCKQIRGYCDLHDNSCRDRDCKHDGRNEHDNFSDDSEFSPSFQDESEIESVDLERERVEEVMFEHRHNEHLALYREEQMNRQAGMESPSAFTKSYEMVRDKLFSETVGVGLSVDGFSSCAALYAARLFCLHWDWIKMVPTPVFHNQHFQRILIATDYRRLSKYYTRATYMLWIFAFIGAYKIFFNQVYSNAFILLIVIVSLGIQKNMFYIVEKFWMRKLRDRNTMSNSLQVWRDQNAANVCKAFGIIGALYAISKVYNKWRRLNPQGSLEPKTAFDVAQRDEEDNVWTEVVKRELPFSRESYSSDCERLTNTVSKNLVYGTIIAGDRRLMANGLFLKSNVVIIPNHYFETDTLDVTFRKKNPDASGGKFATKLSKSASYQIPNTDLCVCYSSTGGSFRDIVKFFPLANMDATEFHMQWRAKNGEITNLKGMTNPCITSNNVCTFDGGTYASLSGNTFSGMCGAVLVSRGVGSAIVGVHLGGIAGKPKGCYGSLTQFQIVEACERLANLEGVLLTGTAGKFEKQVLGVEFLEDTALHFKSPLKYMPKDSQVEYFGSCAGAVSSKSTAQVTLISDKVMEIMDSPNVYCGPVMRPEWFGWQACLSNLAVPALPYEHDLLVLAVRDYKSSMLERFRDPLWIDARPLTDHENLCGIPKKKFMDAIKLSTSIGYPLKGNKRKHVIELESTEEKPNNREFTPEIMAEINRCEDCYRRGERAYTIAKACKKDEILDKEKCRIFYGNPISLTWLIRKYFLPIVRVMQMNPKISECAVGINSHGPEWDELHHHIFTHGEDRLIGGDYGKYDQKLPSQLLLAAIRILIDFARECNYSDEDLRIMSAMSGDIVYAMIAYNGDLIGLTEGTHISGNSLTVILNGICGSLNLRAYFYDQNRPTAFESRIPFRDAVSLMTYGDDNIGSVSPKIDNFTIKGASEFLKRYGQVYTMPDKNSELVDFLPCEDFEFLKRRSVYCEHRKLYFGALADKSIFKMLHMYLRPKGTPLSPQMACANNIDTALREWFNHGPKIYDERRLQLKKVAKESCLEHLTQELNISYTERVGVWNTRYTKNYTPFEISNEVDEVFDTSNIETQGHETPL